MTIRAMHHIIVPEAFMVRSYLHAFISMQYVFILPAPAILIFILAACYFKTGIPAFRIAALITAMILAVLLVRFYTERMSIPKKLSRFKNWKEYNDSYIIGQAFMLEDRMLVYDNHKILEFYYQDIKELKGGPGKRDNWDVVYISADQSAKNTTSSKGQAERLAYYLKTKNPELIIEGIEPSGDGILSHIESGKDQPTI